MSFKDKSLEKYITAASFKAASIEAPNAWVGHLPFASWIIQQVKPKIFVELGTHTGNSYFSFCQTVEKHDLPTSCYAVDTWAGDEHAGHYSDEIFYRIDHQNREKYSHFSKLMRMTFDDALSYFADASIELLHIDGLHTYEAVKHDFESWLPKLAPGAVVLFHDTQVRERNFGVWKLWQELKEQYPLNIEFLHSHGLGVLQLNNAEDHQKVDCLEWSSKAQQSLVRYFAALGDQHMLIFDHKEIGCALAQRDGQLATLNQAVADRDGQLATLNQAVADRDGQLATLNKAVAERDGQLATLNQAVADRDGQLATLNQAVADRDGQLATLNQAVADRDGQLATLNQAVADRDGQLATLNQAVAERDGQLATLQAAVESAKAWQKRSWAKRAFHRWRWPNPKQGKKSIFKKFKKSSIKIIDKLIPYIIKNPKLLLSKKLTDEERQLIIKSGFFNADWYLEKYLEVDILGLKPLDHFLRIGIHTGRDPGPLFDNEHYQLQLKRSSQNRYSKHLVLDYLRGGWKTSLNPNAFFDVKFYLENNPDVATSGIEPLSHYISFGSRENRNPHPIFDVAYYLKENSDIVQAGVEPLQHFIINGLHEGRAPSASFKPNEYLAMNPDVAKSGIPAALHYVIYGRKENRPLARKDKYNLNASDFFFKYIETKPTFYSRNCHIHQIKSNAKISIIIPVYKGFEETINCVNSVLRFKEPIISEIIVINDLSPDKRISDWLDDLKKSEAIKLVNHIKNKGFVSSVNEGITLSENNDVILLNSDTIVTQNWASRLAWHAHSEDKVGTVTAFSNNATICSWPNNQGGGMPPGIYLDELDEAFYNANRGKSINIPTAVGFCMYIKRMCIEEVGIFDEQAFGLGYGEENDFCMRATSLGWTHLLACDTFVFHSGETSFGKESPSRSRALETLVKRYPDYLSTVARHIEKNAADPYRIAATCELFRKSKEPKILFISHSLGGGVDKHIYETISHVGSKAKFLLMQPNGDGVIIALPGIKGHPSIFFNKYELNLLIPTLRSFGVSRIHIHHFIYLNLDLKDFVEELNLPFDFTSHDYFVICPRINLMKTPDSGYCGEPEDSNICDTCISANPGYLQTTINSWRSKNIWLLEKADRIICPSKDVKHRLARYAPHGNYVIAWHEPVETEHWPIKQISYSHERPMRIGIIGVLAKHKGWNAVINLARQSTTSDYLFIVIGYSEFPIPQELSDQITETSKYEDNNLEDLISKNNIDLIWFPSECPETYSYTLTVAINSGLPIAASNLGAFPERLSGRPQTWLLEPRTTGANLKLKFEEIRLNLENIRVTNTQLIFRYKPSNFFYSENYIETKNSLTNKTSDKINPSITIRKKTYTSIIVIPDRNSLGAISPCGYIRLVQPIDYISTKNSDTLVGIADTTQLPAKDTDIIFCQRHVVKSLREAEHLIEHCRKNKIKIVYDLDDDLVKIPSDHPESKYLNSLTNVVVKFLKEADVVWVSTDRLKENISHIRNDAKIIHNKHDHRIWLKKSQRTYSSEKIRLVYMGTATHDKECQFLETVAKKLYSKYKDQITIDLVGGTTRHLNPATFRTIIPDNPSGRYHGFAAWFVNQNWDIGLAPLMADEFNDCKSAIKLMDYAACELPIIASPHYEYLKSFTHEHGIYYVENNAEAWFETVSLLIDKTELRRDSAKITYAHYIEKHTLKNNFEEYINAIERIFHA